MTHISHPLIRPDSLEERRYQLSIALRALDANTMVVLPTGLGKTAIALIVAASRLHTGGGKVLMLAPTKPLVEQHLRFFRQFLMLSDESLFAMFTGETPPAEREAAWKACRICFATPQVIKNDCIAGRYTLSDVSLMVVDECHRAVGNYAYVFLAHHYAAEAQNPLLLAMTASPGGDAAKVQEVCTNLGIEAVETRTETDEDVVPYIHDREIHYVNVDLPPELEAALQGLRTLLESRLSELAKLNYYVPKPERLSMKALNLLNVQIQERMKANDRSAYAAASLYAECMKIRHAVSLAETQGSEALKLYLARLAKEGMSAEGSKAGRRLTQDPVFRQLFNHAQTWTHELHPKPEIIHEIVRRQLEACPDTRIIIFATYRDTVQMLADCLNSRGIDAERFVGQATRDAEKGLTQKKQIEALARFRKGEFRVLIATSVGEEGLDVPSTDMVIFYEAVPSEIRSIQRKGRTGRSGSGRIVVLVTKNTSDEKYRFISQNREKAMVSGIKALSSRTQAVLPTVQTRVDEFLEKGPGIAVDDREMSSRVVEKLHELGVSIHLRRLEVGDYAIGDRILVERKTARDFVDTLVDRDLFGQISALAGAVPRPILIIEGGDLFSVRNIHQNAIRGAISAITVDMGVTLLRTGDAEDTATMLYVIAQREEGDRGERKVQPRKSYRSPREEQEYTLASFPNVGLRHARLLLEHFGSIKAVIEADRKDLTAVPGIGEKTADTIWDLSRRLYQR